MFNLITRFHLLLLTVLTAITIVALARMPADFAYAAIWGPGGRPDLLWPRNLALAGPPVVALFILLDFAVLGQLLTKSRLLMSKHILEPALTVLLAATVSVQMGLLLIGVGSDLDLVRLTGFGLAAVLAVTGVVLTEAERNSYAGLRMPWPVPGEKAWRFVHRISGAGFMLTGVGLAVASWKGLDLLWEITVLPIAVTVPVVIAALATILAPPD